VIAPSAAERYLAPVAIPMAAKMVAIVDDDESMRSALHSMLKSVGFPSQGFASAEEFLRSGQQQTACLITDLRMPGISGLELQARLNAELSRIPIIFISAHGEVELRLQALIEGEVEIFAKTFVQKKLHSMFLMDLHSGN